MAAWKGLKQYCISAGSASASKQRVKCSSLFLPRTQPDSQQASIPSHRLLLGAGLIRQSSAGVYHILPLGMRALQRLVALVDYHMQAIGGTKMALPILTPAVQWKTSGRWNTVGPELFCLKGSTGTEYCLGPTHEEAVTELVGSEVTSHRQLPLRLYQAFLFAHLFKDIDSPYGRLVDRKFRDEKRPRYGLLRCKEFWMKDMYTFDASEEKATATYHEVCSAYENIFSTLNLPVTKVAADTGNIGGTLSHEYHVTSSVGEDTLLVCRSCDRGYNKELLSATDVVEHVHMPEHHRDTRTCQLEEVKGIEVAHAFYLGTKYSSIFRASFNDENNTERLCQMGCFGVGISRLLQAILQHNCDLRDDGDERLIWPLTIAPYTVCVLPLTTSQDPSDRLMVQAQKLYDYLSAEVCPDHVILDDRTHLTMGARLRDSRQLGYPCTVIIGHKTAEDEYEVRIQREGRVDTRILTDILVVETVRDLYTQSTALGL